MNWEKIKPSHFFAHPTPHVYAQTLFDTKEYDKLYENQNNLQHKTWEDFDEKYKTGFEFKEYFADIDLKKNIICLWCFKERSNNNISYVEIEGKQLPYNPNTFIITQSKNLKFVETKKKYIRNPFVQLDIKDEVWDDILKRYQK